VVHELPDRSGLPGKQIEANLHIGKARIDNEAITQASGRFTVWNDPDDYPLSNAIQRLVDSWFSMSQLARNDFVGVIALDANELPTILTLFDNDQAATLVVASKRRRSVCGKDNRVERR
jgi:hypothetical protein